MPFRIGLALYGNGSTCTQAPRRAPTAAVEAARNVGAGIMWYFGGHAVSHSINGACWLPYMPVANNSTFLVDQL